MTSSPSPSPSSPSSSSSSSSRTVDDHHAGINTSSFITRNLDSLIVNLSWVGSCIIVVHYFILMSFHIRLIAIKEFGTVIHEFDPYFNYRTAEYLYNNGIKKFFTWYDYKSWYPIGRPIGTTTYPGPQFTATFIKQFIFKESRMSLNDICCFIPAWFGVIASILVGLITYECTLQCNTRTSFVGVMKQSYKDFIPSIWWSSSNTSSSSSRNMKNKRKIDTTKRVGEKHLRGSRMKCSSPNRNNRGRKKSDHHYHHHHQGDNIENGNSPAVLVEDEGDHEEENQFPLILQSPATECGILAMGIMGMVPAHLTRSVGGGFDNESVAISAMCLTFYFWVRSLRADDDSSHRYGIATGVAYFYMVMTWVGYVFVLNMIGLHAVVLVFMGRFSTKLYKSFSIFYVVGTVLAIQVPIVGMAPVKSLEQIPTLLVFIAFQILQFCEVGITREKMNKRDAWRFRRTFLFKASLFIFLASLLVLETGYFRPISSRVRGLFVEQTKTGNPLVDSVFEPEPTDPTTYFRYLHHLCTFAPAGLIFTLVHFGDAACFVITYALTAYYFSLKMVRLMLLLGPAASILGGIAFGRTLTWAFAQLWFDDEKASNESGSDTSLFTNGANEKKKKSTRKVRSEPSADDTSQRTNNGSFAKRLLASVLILTLSVYAASFQTYAFKISRVLSNPSIITIIGQRNDGYVVKLDDYRESYWWLRDNTPEDSRILALWDYGYQIAAIANRTTIADGNTWNHEHVALIAKILTSTEEQGYNIARHLADYVLIWAGGEGDDLDKGRPLAQIANSVYRDHCSGDPNCGKFDFMDQLGSPSPMMRESFLYKLHSHRITEGVNVDPNKFEEVYRSKFGKVRIYKVLKIDEISKSWVKDPQNRICDEPGSWFCRGQYPPALNEVLMHKKDFSQQEDFNRKNCDPEHQKQYSQQNSNNRQQHNNNNSRHRTSSSGGEESYEQQESSQHNQKYGRNPTKAQIEGINAVWEDTNETTELWKVITNGELSDLKTIISKNPILGHVRSSDGRGPMWWAFEHRKQEMVKFLMQSGVSHSERDKDGFTPVDLLDAAYNLHSQQ